jgi:hypothetical protein
MEDKMSDEIKNERKLSEDESKQVAAGKPSAKELSQLSDQQLDSAVGGAVTGKHITVGKITLRKNDGDMKVEY